MYGSRSDIYDDIYGFKDYEKASQVLATSLRRVHPAARTLLDVACGTGRHLEFLRYEYQVEGLDLNPDLLALAAGRLGQTPLHRGDMRSFDLGRRFDVVSCLFGAISFARTREGLGQTIAAMARHLSPGGVLVVEPWLTPDQYWRHNIKLDIAERPGLRVARMYVGEERDGIVTNENHFLVGEPNGVTHYVETHEQGLYSQDDYRRAFEQAGLPCVTHEPTGLFGYGLWIAQARPAA